MKRIIWIICWTLMTTPVLAKKVKILTLKNLDEKTSFDLHIETDDEEKAIGLKLYDHEDKEWKEFDVELLSRGLPVKEEGKYKVIILKSKDFENDRGGHFIVDYLKNGLTGSRAHMNIKFDFDGHSWKVLHRGTQIKGLEFKLNKIFGKTVGISKVMAR